MGCLMKHRRATRGLKPTRDKGIQGVSPDLGASKLYLMCDSGSATYLQHALRRAGDVQPGNIYDPVIVNQSIATVMHIDARAFIHTHGPAGRSNMVQSAK